MSVNTVRVHDLVKGEVDPGGATVVLVDRIWPRGVRKESLAHDDWAKDAAPSSDLRKTLHAGDLDFDEFAERYRAELDDDPGSQEVDRLAQIAAKGKLLLAYASRNTEENHAQILAEVIADRNR